MLPGPAAARTWKIMPVGNSLTAGRIPGTQTDGDGFRGYLKNDLGADFEFVGGDGALGLNGHFQSGAKIESFLPGGNKNITTALTTYNPEIVLLHIGTNNTGDVTGPYTQQNTSSYKLRQLINTISAHPSVAYVLVCKIVPKLDDNNIEFPQVKAYNKEIERMFFDNAFNSSNVVVVDMYSALSPTLAELPDKIHPTSAGYQKMASEYSRVVKAITNNPGDMAIPGTIGIYSGTATDDPSILLEWYTPSDPGGIVNMYELRYLIDAEINASNFATGTLVPLRRPEKNSPASSRERTTITEGILGGRVYHFAIRAWDQANNIGTISKFAPIPVSDVLPEPGIAYTDGFDNAAMPGWNADPAYTVSNGVLKNSDGGSKWNKLAVLDSIKYTPTAEFVEVGARYAPGNYGLGGIGLAMLLDNNNYSAANGYMIRVYGNIALYSIINGAVSGSAISVSNPTAQPTYGDTLSVVYRNNITTNSFEVKINGNTIGTVQDVQKRYGTADVLYSGIVLYGSLFNEVDSYSIKIPKLEPERMAVFSTPLTNGEVDKQLGAPLSVKVVDINGVGVANVAVEFNIQSGVGATLSSDDVCSEFGGDYYIEAESGLLESPMGKASDNTASGGKYVFTKTYNQGIAKYPFWICAGSYDLLLRAYLQNSNSNSIYYAIDDTSNLGSETSRIDLGDVYTTWTWSNQSARRRSIYLGEGFHTLYLKGREANTRIDKILLTTHPTFTPIGEGGTTFKFDNVTDPKGIVATDVTFGNQAGEIRIEAFSNSVPAPDNYVEFPAILVNGGTPAHFVATSDVVMQGDAGKPLAAPFAVEVKDAYGNIRRGEQVIFRVTSGDGRFSGSEVAKANTDENGIAEARLVLGYNEVGTVIDAYLNNFSEISHITFRGVPQAGTIPYELVRLNPVDHFETRVNTPLADSLRVKVLNQGGNPYSDYPITFEITAGDGKLNGLYTTVTDSTDRNGISAVKWNIGKIAGENAHQVRVNAALNGAPLEFTTTATPDAAVELAKMSGDGQRQGAGKTFADSLRIKIKDQYGNGIPDRDVRFSVVSGDGNFAGNTGVSTTPPASITLKTDKKGFASVSYTAGTYTGENQIKAEGLAQPPLPVRNFSIFYLTVDQPLPQAMQIVSGNSQTKEVTKDLAPFKVKVLDPFDQSSGAGVRVKFQVTKGTARFNNSDIYETTTDPTGVASATVTLGNIAGEQNVRVTLTDYPDVGDIILAATAAAGPAAKLKPVSPLLFSEQAGGLYNLVVRVTDLFDNSKGNHPVTFSVTDGGGHFEEPQGTMVTVPSTAENGYATVKYRMGANVMTPNTLSVTSSKTDGSGSLNGSPLEFVGEVLPGAPTQLLRKTNNNKHATVGSKIAEPFIIEVRDAGNNPVSNLGIQFVAKGQNAKVDDQSTITKATNTSGQASVLYTVGTVAKTSSDTLAIFVVGYDLSTTYLITGDPGNPAKMVFASDSLVQQALGYTPVSLTPKVKITDVYGNPITNHPVSFQIIQGTGTLHPGAVQQMAVNTVGGLAQATWQLGTAPQQHILQASSVFNNAPLAKSPLLFRVTTTAGLPNRIVLVQPESSSINATAYQPIVLRVRVTDYFQNAIPNRDVLFKVDEPKTNPGVLLDQSGNTFLEKIITTDASGHAEIRFRPTLSTNRVEISVSGSDLPAKLTSYLFVMGEQPTAKRIEIQTSKEVTVPANTQVDVQVAAFDATSGGARVANHTIQFTITKGNGSLKSYGMTSSTRQTGADGSNAREIWNVGTQTGRAVLVINGNTQAGSPDSIIAHVEPAAPFADSSKIQVMTEVKAGIKSVVKIILLDSYGNPVSGREFTLTTTDGNVVTLEQPTAPTNTKGETYGGITSTKAGIVHIGAVMKTDPNFKIQSISVPVNPGVAAKLELLPGQTNQFVGNIGALLKEPLRVRVSDAYDNLVKANDAEVKFALAAGGGSLYGENASKNTAFVRTDASGRASIQLVMGPTADQAYLVEATLSDPYKPAAKVTFTGQSRRPVLPYSMTKVSGDSLSGQVGVTLSEPFVAGVIDKDGIPVWSENNPLVMFTPVIGAGAFVDGEFQKTDFNGFAATHYKFITGGSHSIRAYIPSGGAEVRFTAFAQAGAPVKILPVENTMQEAAVKSALTGIKVMVTDKDGNPVNDVPVTFSLVSQPQQENGAVVSATPVKTGATGQPGIAAASVTLGAKMGIYAIQASSTNLPASEKVLFTINGNPGEPYYLSKQSGDSQYGTRNRALVYPIVALVTDQYQNPVPDVTLVYYTNAAQGNGSPFSASATTDANGLASNGWTLGGNDQCQMIVQKIGLHPSTITYTTFAVDNKFPVFADMPADTTIFTTKPFALKLAAKDDDNDPLTYQITSALPGGATFDAANAILRWTPGEPGQWAIHYRVDDNKPLPGHGFDVDSINVHVETKVSIISWYPLDGFTKIPYNGQQEFGVISTNSNVRYEWFLNNILVPNATGSYLTIKASDYPNGSIHTLKAVVFDANNRNNFDARSWGLKTKVELSSFSGLARPFRGVELAWRTSREDGNLGFDVLRSMAKNGAYTKITGGLIRSRNGSYTFTDTTAVAGRNYFYKLEDFDIGGERTQSDAIMVTVEAPKDFSLLQNYPNPFNPVTTIRYQLPKSAHARIAIFNVNGQEVKTLLDERKDAGYYELRWNGHNNNGVQVGSGVYYYRITAGDFTATKKMLLMR